MCFHSQQSQSAQTLEHRFKASFKKDKSRYKPSVYNGFNHPETPVICHEAPETIQLFSWGFIPPFAMDESFRKNTLNARIETIQVKPSFNQSLQNRCLILCDAFYEWQWLDAKGKKKNKFKLTLPNDEPFAFAGLWNRWTNPQTGDQLDTYTILTTVANELMSEIHNSKKRMPIILAEDNEKNWLQGAAPELQNDRLIATNLNEQMALF